MDLDLSQVELQPSPELKAGSFSRTFFLWLFPVLLKGSKNELEMEDVYQSLPEDSSKKLGDPLEWEWGMEIERTTVFLRAPKLGNVIRKIIWRKYSVVAICYAFDELVIRVLQPIVMKNFVKTFSEDGASNPDRERDQVLLALALVSITGIHMVLYHRTITLAMHIGVKVRLGLSSLIYRKVLRTGMREKMNVGKLCNMLSSDVGRFDFGFIMLPFIVIGPLQVAIYGYLLWGEIGWTCLAGVGCFLLLLPVQFYIGRLSEFYRNRIADRTDERGSFLNEIIVGIRLIKLYAWEKPFSAVVSKLRRSEIDYVRKGLYLRGTFLSMKSIAQKLVPFCVLILYVATGNKLSAETAFYTVSVFYTLQSVMSRITNGTSALGEMNASANRIEEFLHSREKIFTEEGSMRRKKNQKGKLGEREVSVNFKNYTAKWTPDEGVLKDIQTSLEGDKLVMVVGHVGSGKSSFLHAILSELPIVARGRCFVSGRLSYSSQEAWIFPETIRENILFGLEMDPKRYWNTIRLCCLEEDLDQFPQRDFTIVGERGVALSGGQKARVNLARAIYQNADIYLLDDPLSAVDPKVGRQLLHDCIKDHLKGKLRILATHQLHYLPVADYIVMLNRHGEVWFQGTYPELQKREKEFASLLSNSVTKSYQIGEKSESETTPDSQNCSSKNGTKNGKIKSSSRPHSPVLRSQSEQKKVGSVGLRTYLNYFKSGESPATMIVIFLAFITTQFLFNMLDVWLGTWTNAVSVSNQNGTLMNVEGDSSTENWAEYFGVPERNFYAYVYCTIMAAFILVALFRSIVFFRYCMKISANLHDSMFATLVRARIKFFDDNPSGRIMNRFTKDLNQVDELLPVAMFDFFNVGLSLLGVLAVNVAANRMMLLPAMGLLFGLYSLRKFYLSSARDLNRIESVAKSPMFTHVAMTSDGLMTIRALRAERRILSQFEKIQDTHTSAHFMTFSANRWFSLWLELFSWMFIVAVCCGFLLTSNSSQSGSVGMALSAILSLIGTLQWGIRQSAETENYMTSVERAFEYCNLEKEPSLRNQDDKQLKDNWPREGRIDFRSVSLAYNESGHRALRKVTLSTRPREKLGIVGRTGAGKTSLITALFRMTEICDGAIDIDGVDTRNLGLHTLRSRISIIPQDPVLFTGSLRYNLDPFLEFTDDQLKEALKEVDLHHAVQSLDFRVSSGGSNFSTGQRQLVCLARALLRKNRILVLDEPTANVDPVTDQMVQSTIRTKFSDCTILTIAHRLQTVLDCDRILVLDSGQVVELGTPKTLSLNSDGLFSSMLKQSRNTLAT